MNKTSPLRDTAKKKMQERRSTTSRKIQNPPCARSIQSLSSGTRVSVVGEDKAEFAPMAERRVVASAKVIKKTGIWISVIPSLLKRASANGGVAVAMIATLAPSCSMMEACAPTPLFFLGKNFLGGSKISSISKI